MARHGIAAAEIKHGRISMLAVVGFLLTQYVHLPGDQFQAGPIEALSTVPLGAQAQVFTCEYDVLGVLYSGVFRRTRSCVHINAVLTYILYEDGSLLNARKSNQKVRVASLCRRTYLDGGGTYEVGRLVDGDRSVCVTRCIWSWCLMTSRLPWPFVDCFI